MQVEKPPKSLDPRTLAEIQGLHLRARHIVEGYVSGLHRSPYHGFSIEFAEHREYAPGDDLRYVDWKAFGRTDKFYLKQYEDETNLICYLVVDVSESMHYRSPGAALSKFEYAQSTAAALAWLVLRQQDAVGLVTFDDQLQSWIRPSSNPSHLQQILAVLDQARPERKTAAGPILHELAERMNKRGVVVIMSDLFDELDSLMAGLKHFRHRQHDVIVFHLLDPAELAFPFTRTTLFKGLEQMRHLVVEPRSLRKAYLREMDKFIRTVRMGCRRYDMDYQQLPTDCPLDRALSRYLSARMAKVK